MKEWKLQNSSNSVSNSDTFPNQNRSSLTSRLSPILKDGGEKRLSRSKLFDKETRETIEKVESIFERINSSPVDSIIDSVDQYKMNPSPKYKFLSTKKLKRNRKDANLLDSMDSMESMESMKSIEDMRIMENMGKKRNKKNIESISFDLERNFGSPTIEEHNSKDDIQPKIQQIIPKNKEMKSTTKALSKSRGSNLSKGKKYLRSRKHSSSFMTPVSNQNNTEESPQSRQGKNESLNESNSHVPVSHISFSKRIYNEKPSTSPNSKRFNFSDSKMNPKKNILEHSHSVPSITLNGEDIAPLYSQNSSNSVNKIHLISVESEIDFTTEETKDYVHSKKRKKLVKNVHSDDTQYHNNMNSNMSDTSDIEFTKIPKEMQKIRQNGLDMLLLDSIHNKDSKKKHLHVEDLKNIHLPKSSLDWIDERAITRSTSPYEEPMYLENSTPETPHLRKNSKSQSGKPVTIKWNHTKSLKRYSDVYSVLKRPKKEFVVLEPQILPNIRDSTVVLHQVENRSLTPTNEKKLILEYIDQENYNNIFNSITIRDSLRRNSLPVGKNSNLYDTLSNQNHIEKIRLKKNSHFIKKTHNRNDWSKYPSIPTNDLFKLQHYPYLIESQDFNINASPASLSAREKFRNEYSTSSLDKTQSIGGVILDQKQKRKHKINYHKNTDEDFSAWKIAPSKGNIDYFPKNFEIQHSPDYEED